MGEVDGGEGGEGGEGHRGAGQQVVRQVEMGEPATLDFLSAKMAKKPVKLEMDLKFTYTTDDVSRPDSNVL